MGPHGAIPACIAGGIPACLAAGGSPQGGCLVGGSPPGQSPGGVLLLGGCGLLLWPSGLVAFCCGLLLWTSGLVPSVEGDLLVWFLQGGQKATTPEGHNRGGAWWRPPGRLLLPAVRILLEWILVVHEMK